VIHDHHRPARSARSRLLGLPLDRFRGPEKSLGKSLLEADHKFAAKRRSNEGEFVAATHALGLREVVAILIALSAMTGASNHRLRLIVSREGCLNFPYSSRVTNGAMILPGSRDDRQ